MTSRRAFKAKRRLRGWSAYKKQHKRSKLPPTSEKQPRKKQKLKDGASLSRISSCKNYKSVSGAPGGNLKPEVIAEHVPAVDESAHQPITPNANNWNVAEVAQFIHNIPGCAGYARKFVLHEVDEEALLLVKLEHLMQALSIKLGSALKILARIDNLRL